MNVIIPPKRRDRKTSFKTLVNYVSTRDEKQSSDVIKPDKLVNVAGEQLVSSPGFGQLVDYVGRKTTARPVKIVSISPEGIQRVLSGEVLCETNCFSLDTAAAEMNMTAMQNTRCKDAVYHFILSWQTNENPSADSVFSSVRYCLEQLGMQDHQYVAAIHKDTDNTHCHVSANRVHPENFRAKNMWNDADILQKSCRVLEKEFGFEVDNGSWHMDTHGDLHRTPRKVPSTPRGAAALEIFSDRESLHGYAIRETRDVILRAHDDGKLDWPWLHNMLYIKGLGLREQKDGLAIYDLMNPEGVSVKASDVHPCISKPSMQRLCGPFQLPPPVFDPERPEEGMISIEKSYMSQLHVRDVELRRERREARAIARNILRARYDAYLAGWEKPDLRASERFREIVSHCIAAKAAVRDSIHDPLMRKLMYRVAEFEKIKAMAQLRIQLRDEREVIRTTGQNRPLTLRAWVEIEALQGDVAAISQLRGWAYREKRKTRQQTKKLPEPNAVIYYGPGDDVPTFKSSEHETQLLTDGTVNYLREGQPAVTDFGERVEVYFARDKESDRFNNDLAAELTAWRSGENVAIKGEETAVNRVLYSGVVRNLSKDDGHRFEVSDSEQMASVRATEESLRNNELKTELRYTQADPSDEEDIRPMNRNLPRP